MRFAVNKNVQPTRQQTASWSLSLFISSVNQFIEMRLTAGQIMMGVFENFATQYLNQGKDRSPFERVYRPVHESAILAFVMSARKATERC